MVQRTLTALFSLAVLILPASQLYADSDMMTSVYSGLECQYEDDRWDQMGPRDGNASQDLRRDGQCSLPYSSWDWEYRTTYDRCQGLDRW